MSTVSYFEIHLLIIILRHPLVFNQYHASKKTTPRTRTMRVCTDAVYDPWRGPSYLHPDAVRTLELTPGFCSLQSLRGRLIVLSELLWFKVIERGRLSRGTHEWFSSSLRLFSRSACNIAPSKLPVAASRKLPEKKDAERLLFKVKTSYIMIDSVAIKRNLLCKIFHLSCKIKRSVPRNNPLGNLCLP